MSSSTPAPQRPAEPSRAEEVAGLRPRYQADLAAGTDRFFEPRRTECPWCGSSSLRVRLRTIDLFQHKPGRFVLEACEECHHVFQNPRLSDEGLEFYYRDFYDGLGEKQLGGAFARRTKTYVGRAEPMKRFTGSPAMWLDVGTGHGHFCETARTVFPGTTFDGLDFTDGIEVAEREGRVTRGFRGSFTELAGEDLAGGYDVVSMYHYLEHSTNPREELRAAWKTVRPGGYLMIEVPDAESRLARWLGRWWLPWLQPQHLNFVPLANLRRELTALGFTVVAEQRAEPHDPVDLLGAVWLPLNRYAPAEDAPWHPEPPGRPALLLRRLLLLAGLPLLVLATVLDRVLVKPLAGRAGLANAYRVIARRD
ncbi:class I SAM-dependent methyltransferase [Streptomyces sp. NPDC047108]|uniref:class I SAM-dependent methyltransferase n=1 Tax=Streptomyces sp. NPDC047108 TaxID=3155025 RepID=UPI0033E2CD75